MGDQIELSNPTPCIADDLCSLPAIFKKRHRTDTWDKILLEIEGTKVVYSTVNGKEKAAKKVLEISGSTIQDVEDIPHHPHTFSLKTPSSSRIYYFSTQTEEEKIIVLDKICTLQFSEVKKEDSSACVIS